MTFRGHGTGTIGILAGPQVTGVRPTQTGASLEGETLGGAPMMQIVPVRIANSVALLRTGTVAQGIDYAHRDRRRRRVDEPGRLALAGLGRRLQQRLRQRGRCRLRCRQQLRRVCRPGSSSTRRGSIASSPPAASWPTDALSQPAATGMEGNAGPGSKMMTAIAAYTPNIPWARLGFSDSIDLNGGGTSAATPQIAAAAALWLHQHGGDYPAGSWHARRGGPAGPVRQRVGGQDVTRSAIRPRAAARRRGAQIGRPANLIETERDDASFAFLHLAQQHFRDRRRRPALNVYALELTQLALRPGRRRRHCPTPTCRPDQIPTEQRRRFLEAILDEGQAP